ncbi:MULTISPECIES: flagellin A2 [Haloferax]|uniref:Flagellin n=1 Tax=Haloferax massiliensis TaxID=1476858 RepID=A0A0D6JQW7_9EURY|nr:MULTISPECIES: flagellin A2 [Haloferax]MDS0240191.1 flagellin [Haloferax sp. S2CR25]MDS0443312.1 flagellin [Haloferax sp. S2CR25-2]CQR50306.1 flagellin [Haloferax massiliensis]
MFDNITDDDRGQVGIGTLIVFIAMVLVAAIAAGVLVNTAGFLQATAEDAGQQSVNKVTNRVEVLNTHGTVGGEEDIDNITLTVRLAAGSDAVDMNETSIKYLSGDSVVTLTNQTVTTGDNSATNDSAAGVADSDEFGLTKVTDDDGSFGVLNSMNDRYEVTIDTAAIEDSNNNDDDLVGGLSTGEQVSLEITSRTGGTTQVILTMPQQLAGKTQSEPVEL